MNEYIYARTLHESNGFTTAKRLAEWKKMAEADRRHWAKWIIKILKWKWCETQNVECVCVYLRERIYTNRINESYNYLLLLLCPRIRVSVQHTLYAGSSTHKLCVNTRAPNAQRWQKKSNTRTQQAPRDINQLVFYAIRTELISFSPILRS